MMMALDPALALLCRLGLALLLGGAAIHKARDLDSFEATLRRYQLMPAAVTRAIAPLFAAAELFLALLLAGGWWLSASALATVGLLAVYSAAIAINLYRDRRDFDCGCSWGTVPLSRALVVRNLSLMTAAASLLLPTPGRALVWLDAITVIGGLSAVALLYQAAHLALAQRRAAL